MVRIDCVGTALRVRRQRLDFLHKALNQIAGDTVHAIVVVAVLRIVAFDDEIDRQTGVVAHRFYRGVFDGRRGIRRHRQPGNAAGHGAVDVPVVQRHQRGFVAVFIMHIVNEIQRADVLHRQPVHEVIEARHYDVVISTSSSSGSVFGPTWIFSFSSTPPLIAYSSVFARLARAPKNCICLPITIGLTQQAMA